MACHEPVTYLVVLRFRDNVPRYQLVRVLERPLCDDAVRLMLGEARQAEQVFAGRIVDIDGPIAAHAFLQTLRHGLGITPHGFRSLSRALADFIRVISVACTARERSQQQGQRRKIHRAEMRSFHEIEMRCRH